MTKIEVTAGICDFTTIVNVEDKGGYKAFFRLESECQNWKKVDALHGTKKL